MSNLLELLRSKQKELSAKKSRDNTVKLPNGSSRWRILSHWSGDENAGLPTHDYGKHFIKDFSGEVQAVYICTSKTFGKSCPVCDAITKAELTATDDNAKNLIRNSKAAQRYLVNAVRRTDKGYEQEVIILELPSGAFDDVISLAAQYASDGINIFSMAEGYDVIFNREGTGLKTKYKAMLAPKSTPMDASYLAKAANLSDYVQQEYEEGKTKALVALQNLSGASTPMLPASVSKARSDVAELMPATGKASVTPSMSKKADDDVLDVDLSEVDLSDLDSIE
jgi:hypothetical protein